VSPAELRTLSHDGDDPLTWAKNAARSAGKTLGAAVATSAISFSAFAATSLWSSTWRLAATADAPIDVSDTLFERVWNARSDNIQPNVAARHTAVEIWARWRTPE